MGVCGTSPRGKVGWVCRDEGGQCPDWEGRLGYVLFLCWTTVQRMKQGVQNPSLISAVQPCTGTPGFLGHLSPLETIKAGLSHVCAPGAPTYRTREGTSC